jgi:hypothetical protein
MRRLQLFEFEDQPWLPRVFRDFITDHLRYTHNEEMRKPVTRQIAVHLKTLLERTGEARIIDLCAGAGGPVGPIIEELQAMSARGVEVVLTDLYPNVAAFEKLVAESRGLLRAEYRSINALNVPAELQGIRTVFAGFHHFPPRLARVVLEDAVRKRATVAIFEPLDRTPRMLVLLGVMSFVRGLTHTHIVGRLTLSRALLTYLLPIAPLLFAWDGMVSVVRSYTASELLDLASGAENATSYQWSAGRFEVGGPLGPMPTTYLLGTPRL